MEREQTVFSELLSFINRYTMKQEEEDRWSWRHSTNGCYSTSKAYQHIMQEKAQNDVRQQEKKEFKWLWNCYAPRRVQAITWKILKQRMATKENLQKRGVLHSDEELMCSFCGEERETDFHLFFDCKFSRLLWNNYYDWLNIMVVSQSPPYINFLQNCENLGSGDNRKIAATL